ncbi:MAG: hypothetical protein RMM29_03500 [Planctomycetota bacterium]|nr:hypothetical protein [Planctomycetota bacterium]MCX8039049.1 hypothetical protein [Planctomycetota bacterium]MDW8372699.1 hypothetical protein [Planctomycetota bacterium]
MEQRIPVIFSAPGMVLARPVVVDGLVLIGEGTALTDAMIALLLKRGVPRIVVRGQPLPRTTERGSFEEQMAGLAERFARVEHLPLMAALRACVANALARRS